MSERDELHTIIYDELMITNIHDSILATADITDAILAAGYRRIPDDCVMVLRDDARRILDAWVSVEWRKADSGIDDRLKAALTATRHGED